MVRSLAPFVAPALGCLAWVGCASRASLIEPSSTAKAARPAPVAPADLVAEAPNETIVAIHKSKCGSCHTRVEPGSLARATAESAMQRHRRRTKLSEREWSDMVDY